MSQESLKRKRTTTKSALTRCVNELRRLVAEDKRDEVLRCFSEIKDCFQEFSDAHSAYHDTLTDEADIIASDDYFEKAETKYIDGISGVRDYIVKSDPKVVSVSQSQVQSPVQCPASHFQSKLTSVKLPPVPQPDIFSGKPESYPMWKASFKTLVGKHDIDFDEKMFYLKQYTAGEARSAIEALFLCPGKESYEAALEILESRFGNTSMVASAYRKRLETWPKIADRDGKGLQKFSDYLRQICVAKKTYKSLDILSDEFENRKLLSKLPAVIVNEWIEKVVGSDPFPSFDEFAEFIASKSKIANHSLWAAHGTSERAHQGSMKLTPELNKVRSYSNASQSASFLASDQDRDTKHIVCPVCGGGHKSAKCAVFANISLSERKQVIRDKNMCFGCLGLGHRSKSCRSRHTCAVCTKRHPTLLHDYNVRPTSAFAAADSSSAAGLRSNAAVPLSADSSSVGTSHGNATVQVLADSSSVNTGNCDAAVSGAADSSSATSLRNNGRALLGGTKTRNRATTMILPVVVSHKSSDESLVVYALLDTQSDTHFISNKVAAMLNISGPATTLDLKTMNGRMKRESTIIDGVEIQSVVGGSKISLSKCFTRDCIPCNRDSIPTGDTLADWPHLSGIELPPYYEQAPIGLLIGFHCSAAMKPLEVVTGDDGEPFGWRTSLGWCVLGVVDADANAMDEYGFSHTVHGCIALRTECREAVLDENENDHKYSDMPGMSSEYSAEDVRFMDVMSTRMFQRTDKHYEAPLPLKSDSPFPMNRYLAEKRLQSLKRKFHKDPSYHRQYDSVIKDMLDNGFAEVVPPDESPSDGRTWYIPHHGVIQSKLRVVFDCSATCQGVSLNERLLQGPDLSNSLLGILLRFRLGEVGVTCDIQKMYHQFLVSPNDRDLLRFLWWPQGDLTSEPVDYRMKVHLFGARSSPAVATYGLRKIATDHAEKHSPNASLFVMNDFYVDDGVTAVSTPSSCCKLVSETQDLLAEGGLKCHKVMSNSQEVLLNLPDDEKAPICESNFHKTLGVLWDITDDQFCFPLQFDRSAASRRGLLSSLHKFFDPLGVISPLLLPAKVLLQRMCFLGCNWDDPISGQLLKSYYDWCDLLDQFDKISIPRVVPSDQQIGSLEMHHFADASSSGYAACSYLRWVDEHRSCHVSFLMGKCRVVPLKPVLSVPRLELVAAVLCVQIASKLKLELPFECPHFFWTDSTVVLGYIKNEASRFKVFVANRVQRIHDDSRPEEWFHISGAENPADDGSRGVLTDRWLKGPAFLHEVDLQIPECKPEVDGDDIEVRCLSSCSRPDDDEVLEVHVWRNWFCTLKMWAWVLRFFNNCRGHAADGELRLDEIERAKVIVLRQVQKTAFGKELHQLRSQKRVSRRSRLHKLDAFVDSDGLIRVGGRIRHSTLSSELKHPVVLPGDHRIASSIVGHYHQQVHHQGRGLTCAEIRSHGFWILGLHRLVKRLIHSCVVCSRLRGKPCEQKMSDLPADRLSPGPPFLLCGTDLFGPFLVKCGRREVKRYGVMFTCLVSRAVHLEVVYSLSTDSFLNSFRRFVALRGPVRQLRCDQGTNFVGARGELLRMGCEIKFNPPASSHRGGVWERMIGVSRRVIEGILVEHGSRLDDEGLLTIMAETAAVVNSRPLSVENSTDPQSLEPLTPNHLLTMKSKVIHKPQIHPESVNVDLYARRQWKRVQFLIDLFWSRWKREIVQLSMSRSKWNTIRKSIKVGDVVLLVDDQTPRSSWKMARVTDVHLSDDNLVRSVKIRLADGSSFQRPVQKLIHLLSTLWVWGTAPSGSLLIL